MRLSAASLIGALALFATAPACLAEPELPLAQDQQTSGGDSTMVCKFAGQTGSRIPVSYTCKSKHDWDQLSRIDRAQLEKAQNYGVNPDRDLSAGANLPGH